MKNVFGHFKTVCIHRFWVGYYCFKLKLYWRGLVHDLSKFSPTEFIESVKYYQGTSSPINAAKKEKGYSNAWQHHKGRNKHHYEYWTDNYDAGTTCIMMPFEYACEMICDWMGAGRAYHGKTFTFKDEYEWYLSKRDSMKIHPAIKAWCDAVMSWLNVMQEFDLSEFLFLYDQAIKQYELSNK